MTDIFDMEDEVTGLASEVQNKLGTAATPELNYKIIEAIEEGEEEGNGEHPDPQDYYPGQQSAKPIKITNRQRRRSSIISSYEVNIGNSYVSSSLIINKSPVNQLVTPKLSDFEPIKVLGKGSYGKVLLVREVSSGRLFAQKQLKKASLIINQDTNEIHEKNYRRTLNEKQILELVNHQNIVKLFYAFQDNDKLYLILEYLDGGELFHHLAMEKFMSEKNASYYIAQMVLAIRYLHVSLKVIYRDLKPENCMLNSKGNLVLTDFGLSKVSSDDDKKNHSMTGTAQYMAPEVLKGEPYDYSVDWWSLGCVAFDLLTGSPPFTGNNHKKIMEKIVQSKKTLKFPFYLSLDAKDLLRKLLQVNPDKRFNVDDDFEKFKKHRFFRYVNWKELEDLDKSEAIPPILPIITDPILAENFDSEFTEMAFTPQNGSGLDKDIFNIKGFSYTNPKFIDTNFLDPKKI
ncbi:Serine/threonine-protein kinase psk1 [Candida viswanathii]|uniref:Serine/threonine-protein kinase psk1 n=1 Tax=Candida viswanathii TaxID=5486 RepID=A0A367XSS0_9ASCO|nr:Serine/threonine-protein kinase psk1 [Candida viswanathii]RCK56675.1 Serine/threonine-protein kinase psk1 [Candida viswanathii]